MTQPENYTAAQASDPQTSGQMLADIAAQRPDLRPAVAANPSTYPALLDWLKSLGEPAVDAALAARAQATQVLPAQPVAPAAPPAPSWAGGAPAATPVAAPAPMAPQAPAPAYAAAPGYGAPQGMPPGGMPQGMPPGGMTPGYAGTPTQKSNKTLWIVLIIIAVVLLLGGLTVFLILRAAQNAAEDVGDDLSDIVDDVTGGDDVTGDDSPMSFGDDPALDALYTACGDGDWQACDDLYNSAPVDSEYFAFADTCGGQWDAGTTTFCVEAMNEGSGEETPATFTGAETIYFDALQQACAAEDWAACDDLYFATPAGSDYETFGDTCGLRNEGAGLCINEFGDGVDPGEPMTRGSSAGLDALWTACEGGDTESCELLYWESPSGSEYETFAQANR